MSSALTGNKIKDSYQALLKIGTNGSLDPTTPITISDGLGNDTPLQLASDKLLTNYSGNNIGLNLDFANSIFQFGDYTGSVNPTYLHIDVNNSIAKLQTIDRELKLMLNQNIALGEFDGNYTIDNVNGAVFNNTIIGNFNWGLTNSNPGAYPLFNNCFINDASGENTQSICLLDSIFINNDSVFDGGLNVDLNNNNQISSCFVFGSTRFFGDNLFKFFSPDANELRTNVIIFNTSNTDIGYESNNLFILNASGVYMKDQASCINIFGGDFFDYNGNTIVQAGHRLTSGKTTSVNIYGQKALAKNNFSNVFGYYNESYGTAVGQVQIEQKQLFADCPDGSGWYDLVDTLENRQIFVENNTTYLIDAKFVSTNGDGNKTSSGNWTLYKQYMICVDGSGNLSRASTNINGFFFNPPNQDVVDNPGTNEISFQVRPDTVNSVHCWVRAEIVLHKIKAV